MGFRYPRRLRSGWRSSWAVDKGTRHIDDAWCVEIGERSVYLPDFAPDLKAESAERLAYD